MEILWKLTHNARNNFSRSRRNRVWLKQKLDWLYLNTSKIGWRESKRKLLFLFGFGAALKRATIKTALFRPAPGDSLWYFIIRGFTQFCVYVTLVKVYVVENQRYKFPFCPLEWFSCFFPNDSYASYRQIGFLYFIYLSKSRKLLQELNTSFLHTSE